MKILLLIVAICISQIGFSQKVEVINTDRLIKEYNSHKDTTYIINFWATWCKPCIEELPYFLKLEQELINEPVKFLFISLDDSKYKKSRVMPFVEKNNMKNVFILDDNDPNEWIPRISEEWTGSIPATLIKKNDSFTFLERKLNYEQLKQFVDNEKGAQ